LRYRSHEYYAQGSFHVSRLTVDLFETSAFEEPFYEDNG
jgi:hypothetical protein